MSLEDHARDGVNPGRQRFHAEEIREENVKSRKKENYTKEYNFLALGVTKGEKVKRSL